MSGQPSSSDDTSEVSSDELIPAARLFGRLLVMELDARTLMELRADGVRDALAASGVEVPGDDELPELGHRFFELFLHPEGALPPVQSLWKEGQYEGDPASGVRKIADAANRTLGGAARNAAVDHIGCILLLWAELRVERPELATLLVEHHLAWAEPALQHAARDEGFYGAVSRNAVALIRELRTFDAESDFKPLKDKGTSP